MQELIKVLVVMSVAGSLVSLLLHILAPLTSRLCTATWHYYAKVIVVLLLVLPLSLLFRSCEIMVPGTPKLGSESIIASEYPRETILNLGPLPTLVDLRDVHKSQHTSWIALCMVWLLGATVTLTQKWKSYLSFRQKVMSQNRKVTSGHSFFLLMQCKDDMGIKGVVGLAQNAAIGTPMLTGLVSPTIMIPDQDLDEDELRFIFRHELTHLRRKDLWLKAVALTANVIHWFNPLSFAVVRDINWLCEISCDEAVVESMDFSSRKRYAEAILSTLSWGKCQHLEAHFALSGDKNRIKRRLTNMLYFRRPDKGRILVSMALALIVCVVGVVLATTKFSQEADHRGENSALHVGTESYGHNSNPASVSLIWPTPSAKQVVAGFGVRLHPITQAEVLHSGLDIAAKDGDIIVASDKGEVTVAEYLDGYGNTIVIDHGTKLLTLYAHCSELLVQMGDMVEAGQTIARVGSTGYATGPHLHFEVQLDGEPQDPLEYVAP